MLDTTKAVVRACFDETAGSFRGVVQPFDPSKDSQAEDRDAKKEVGVLHPVPGLLRLACPRACVARVADSWIRQVTISDEIDFVVTAVAVGSRRWRRGQATAIADIRDSAGGAG